MPDFAYSAVLLAGGRSRRMGRDKALLNLPGDGRPLWLRQLDDVLRPLRPVELFFSGPPRAGLPAGVPLLEDTIPGNLGPLAGIVAAFASMRADSALLLVLAVDLPVMTAEFFRERLLPCCQPGRGAVPRDSNGFFEPLAAIYPCECLPFAREQLRGPDRSLQTFVRAARDAGLIVPVSIKEPDARLFANWNTVEDLHETH